MPTPENDSPESRFYLQLEAWIEADERQLLISIRDKIDEFLGDPDEEGDGDGEGTDDPPELPQTTHLENFKRCHPKPPKQRAIGRPAQSYLNEINRVCGTSLVWPGNFNQGKLDRADVHKICRDHTIDPLVVYAAIMAWGSRDFSNFWKTLEQPFRGRLIKLIEDLRTSSRSRSADFAYAQNAAAGIDGLGISYFTKLLFFLRPANDAYILDQFTAKSSLLLFEDCPIRIQQKMPHPRTTADDYEWFCQQIEKLAENLGPKTNWPGDVVESAMFDSRWGVWRAYLKVHFARTAGYGKAAALRPAANGAASSALRLAALVEQAHAGALNSGVPLPPGRAKPQDRTRVIARCGGRKGTCWQYAVNKDSLIAMVQISSDQVDRYLAMQRHFGTQGPEFCQGIHRPNSDSKTYFAMQIVMGQGFGSDEASWPQFAADIVQKMHRLFVEIDPTLS